MSTTTWFITGSSRGLGRALTEAALAAGHQVIATARRPEQLSELATAHPQTLLPAALDVTEPAQVAAALAAGREHFGAVDVIVNNAGYANVAPVETGDDGDFRTQFETNFWGVYNVSKAAIPILREQGGGTLVQISSIGGRVGGSPGIASYQAAKFAVDGFSRVLAAETAPFGISVMVVEPSGFDTDWAGDSMTVHQIPEGYETTVGAMHERVRSGARAAGDPQRAAETIVRVVASDRLPSHLLLGTNAVEMALEYSRHQIEQAGTWSAVGRSADYAEPYPVMLPPEAAA
jgi:NAD(P)-dependent dehydrogenase (short-subunit alcohol dehydrogenase family)